MIILASASPRRKQLLSYLIPDFKILSADLDEDKFLPLARTPEEFVTKLSLAKAKKVISQIAVETGFKPVSTDNNTNIIISADTIVVLFDKNGGFQILGKQKNEVEAILTLKTLRGKTHQVYTGFTVINQKTGIVATDFSVSNVTFKHFSDKLLKDYIDKYQPYDKAGAYAIQEMGTKYIEKFDGSLTGIIGLPLEKLALALENFSVKLKPNWQEKVSKMNQATQRVVTL